MSLPATDSLKKIAIIGGGPAALYLLKEFYGKGPGHYTIDIFEAGDRPGCGMPYSEAGANPEHIANISGNEIPELLTPLTDWIKSLPTPTLHKFGPGTDHIDEHKVVPRLLLGQYLEEQFNELLERAIKKGIAITAHLSTRVKDIKEKGSIDKVEIETADNKNIEFDFVIVCTGHSWPHRKEGEVTGYFDSPYPPRKLMNQYNHPVALKGGSLTAIDAIVTLANLHGQFTRKDNRELVWTPNKETPEFRMVIHSLKGLLPAVRIHLDDPQLKNDILLSEKDIFRHIINNGGFLSLDFLFERNFKEPMKSRDPEFYQQIKDKSIEEFTNDIMQVRLQTDPIQLFKAEYQEAIHSIQREKPVYWKELLAALNFLINYPAKHLSAEDMIRLQNVLMPLITIIIAFVPLESCEQLIALFESGRLDIVAVDEDSETEPCKDGGTIYHYKDESGTEHHQRYFTFIDCTGQPPLSIEDLPFRSLRKGNNLSPARIKFRSPEQGKKEKEKGNNEVQQETDDWYLCLPGMAITDSFSPIDRDGNINPRIYMLATPFISGFNPDFSGLDFCAKAAKIVTEDILS